MMNARWLGVGLATGLLSLAAMNYMFVGGSLTESPMATGIGDADKLVAQYDRWKERYQRNGHDQKFTLGMRYNKALSTEFNKAFGELTVDLSSGQVLAYVHGLEKDQSYDVWMIDNHDGAKGSVKPETGDQMVRLGSLEAGNDSWSLETKLSPDDLRGFELDLVTVTKAEATPKIGNVIVGMPSLFQKVYYNELRQPKFLLASMESSEEGADETNVWTTPFQALVPTPAYAAKWTAKDYLAKNSVGKYGLTDLVAKGEDLFFNETFDGNGRTCGTCHSAKNNFTIDEHFISTLPASDKLFVAEHGVGLDDLEKPELMRKFALILENLDGFENPGLMRATPHTFALNTSLTPGPDVVGAGRTHAIGWSGDGAPLPGGLRNFATGAVTQHFTSCLPRQFDGSCFRLPTDGELDAMEAFQRSLGRQYDPNLDTLTLKGFVPSIGQSIFTCEGAVGANGGCDGVVVQGRTIDVTAGKCNLCHFNAGATVATRDFIDSSLWSVNANLDTGVEEEITSAKLYDPTVPCDGGFGSDPGFSACGGLGTGAFNIAPLVEAADTLGLFHNNLAQTLRNGMAFYNGGAFNNSNGAKAVGIQGFGRGAIGLSSPDIDATSQFLEVLNALENIRNVLSIEKHALYAAKKSGRVNLKNLLEVAYADTEDAYQVLQLVPEHIGAANYLKSAAKDLKWAAKIPVKFLQKKLIYKAMKKQRSARDSMCEYGSDKVLCEEDQKPI